MAVDYIEKYRQQNGEDILKVILKPTQKFPDGFFYCDESDEELVRNYTWCLGSQKQSYVIAVFGSYYNYSRQFLYFHQEKAYNILGYHPDYINHINMVEFDNVNMNLDKVTNQQNCWSKPSKGYYIVKQSFCPKISVNSQHIYAKCVHSEVEAIQSAYLLETQYEDYRYNFLKDRRQDLDLLDMERTGILSEEEVIYRHVCRHAKDNAWYIYRYNLFDYFKDNHIPIPKYSLDSEGFMTSPITGKKLCPF